MTYASGSDVGIVLAIRQGMVNRGADISWLSQYPHEAECVTALAHATAFYSLPLGCTLPCAAPALLRQGALRSAHGHRGAEHAHRWVGGRDRVRLLHQSDGAHPRASAGQAAQPGRSDVSADRGPAQAAAQGHRLCRAGRHSHEGRVGSGPTPPSDGCPSTCRQSVARVAKMSRDVAKMSRAGSRSVAPPSRVGRAAVAVCRASVAVCRAAVAAGRRVARCRGVSRCVKGGSPPVTPPSRSVAPPSRAGRGLSRRRRDLSRRRRGRVATRRIAVAVCRGVSWVSRAIFFLSKPRHVLGHPSEGGVPWCVTQVSHLAPWCVGHDMNPLPG